MPLRYRKNPLTAGRVIEGMAFVVTPDNNKLHTLNGTATELWRRAAEGLTLAEAAALLVESYQVDRPTAERDARECLDDLVARQVLVAETE